MQIEPTQPLKLLCCNATALQDKKLAADLIKHFASLKHQNQIIVHQLYDINAGREIQQAILDDIFASDIILLLISANFMNDEYYSTVVSNCLDRHDPNGYSSTGAYVIGVLLNWTFGEKEQLAQIRMLPINLKPIAAWSNRAEAFKHIVSEISNDIYKIRTQRWISQGALYFASQQYDQAIDAYQHAFDLNPNWVDINYAMGLSWRDKHIFTPEINFYERTPTALNYFKRTIRFAPQYPQAYFYLGKELCRFHKFEEALIAFDNAFRLSRGYVLALYEKGNVLCNLGREDEALNTFSQLLRYEPTYTQAYESMREIFYNGHRFEKGNQIFQEALKVFDDFTLYGEGTSVFHYALYGKGWSLYRLGRNREAFIEFERIAEKYPSSATPYYGKGMMLYTLQRSEEALTAFNKAIERDQTLAPAYYGKALLFQSQIRYEEALAVLNQAIKIYPNYSVYHYEMGNIFKKWGRSTEAMQSYEEAKRLGYNEHNINLPN